MDRDAVLRSGRMLEGSRIYVSEDLCPESMKIKKEQVPMLKQAKRDGQIAYFGGTKLVIQDKRTRETQNKVRTSWSTSQKYNPEQRQKRRQRTSLPLHLPCQSSPLPKILNKQLSHSQGCQRALKTCKYLSNCTLQY